MQRSYQRVLTNVGKGFVTYKVNVTAPYGSRVEVLPTKLDFRKKYEKQSYTTIMSYKGSKDRKVSIWWTSLGWRKWKPYSHKSNNVDCILSFFFFLFSPIILII